MDKLLAKKILLGIAGVIMFFGLVTTAITFLEAAPFFLYGGLAISDFKKKNITLPMLILAGVMILVNVVIPSWVDVFLWVIIFGLYLKE